MNAEELKTLKEELKRELLEEMNQKPYKKNARALQEVRNKYIDSKNGALAKIYDVPQNYRMWDVIRKLTTMILGKNRIDELEEEEAEKAKRIATELCEYAIHNSINQKAS